MKSISHGALIFLTSLAFNFQESKAAYSVTKTIPLTVSGSTDFLTVDPVGRRLYVSHGPHVVVINIDTKAQVGDVSGLPGDCLGIGIAHDANKGYASNGDNSLTVFKLSDYSIVKTITVGAGPDFVMFDNYSKKIFCFNADDGTVSVVDPATDMVTATIQTGAGPEMAASDEAGRIYLGCLKVPGVTVLNTKTMTKETVWAGDANSRSMAIDIPHHRVFNGAGSNILCYNTETGTKIGSIAGIAGSDGMVMDPSTGTIFMSGSGSKIKIVKWTAGTDALTSGDLIDTKGGGRTIACDPVSHSVFVAAGLTTVQVISDPSEANIELKARLNKANNLGRTWNGTNMEFYHSELASKGSTTFYLNGKETIQTDKHPN